MGEQREDARPGIRAGTELSTDQASSSPEVYDAEAGRCVVCGRTDDNLSNLARCWGCIRAASDAWHAKIGRPLPGRAGATPEEPPSGEGLPRWAQKLFAPRLTCEQSPPRPQPTGHPRSGPALQARLSGLLRRLAATREGERNTMLHWCACRVGEMVAAGELPDAHAAAEALATVGLATGLNTTEVRRTIASGFTSSGVVL